MTGPAHVAHMAAMGLLVAGAAPGLLRALVGAVTFWTPVFGVHRRLSDGARTLYLYLAMPMLDLAGVLMVAAGDAAGGLAMIVGMLPMAATTVALTWRWITAEDRRVARDDGGIREAA